MARHDAGEVVAGAVVIAAAAGFLIYGIVATGRATPSGLRLHAEFDNIGTLAVGGDVRIAGVRVGRVDATSYDSATYRARVDFDVDPAVHLPTDSSAQIASAGLLGSPSLSLSPGGADAMLRTGQAIEITQSAADLEDLLGKFIFNVGSLADASQKQLRQAATDRQTDGSRTPATTHGAAAK